jgi:YbbR domain-containing protein
LTRALDSTNPPEVLLDLSDARPGLNSYPINVRDIELPREVEVVSIDPPAITLELERQETRVVPVRPLIEGTPAPGFMVAGYRVIPVQYTVQGPESLVLALEFIDTSSVSVEGATGPVEAMIQPILPDPLLRMLGLGSLQIIIDIAPVPEPDETPVQE